MPPIKMTFVQSAKSVDQLPDSPAEVAFVGRSNVGKSSLINAMANQRQLAHVSGTPGRTQLLNLFSLPTGATIMDLPGYGYAAVTASVRNSWQPMIEGYLTGRESLVMVMVIVDGEIGPTKLDLQLLDWLRHEVISHTIVATKQDKVRPSKLGARRTQLARACGLEATDVLWVSSSKGTGIDALRSRVLNLLDLDFQ